MSKKYFLIILVFVSNIFSQPVKVYLNTLTKLEEDPVHLVVLSNYASEKLVLPKSVNNEISCPKKYFDLFHSWDTDRDEKISVLVYQFKDEDLLYVDKNNDNDLSNDGDPIIFPLNKDSINIDIVSEKDKNQKLKLALFRKPDLPDSLKASFIDQEGNIIPKFLPLAKIYSDDFNYNGKSRSFYFDYRITLKKGNLNIGPSSYLVGLFDYNNNGSFNDVRDLLIIDLNKSGKLNLDIPSNVFSLDDIFTIDKKNYKLTEVDKYGKYFVIEETKEEPTSHYLNWVQEEFNNHLKNNILSNDFWKNKLVSLNGEEIDLSSFRGKYLLLNIWGEWCHPCINEIEELKLAYEENKSKVAFLGALKVVDLSKAKKLINEKNIIWTNTFLSKEIINQFKIISYPTNILIYPDGVSFIKGSVINRTFFEKYIK